MTSATRERRYSFVAEPFGELECVALSKADAAKIASRYRGWRDLRRVATYVFCERCESAPCCCARRSR